MLLEWAGVWPAIPVHVALPDRQWLAGWHSTCPPSHVYHQHQKSDERSRSVSACHHLLTYCLKSIVLNSLAVSLYVIFDMNVCFCFTVGSMWLMCWKCYLIHKSANNVLAETKKTWSEVVKNDCQSGQLCMADAVDCRKWRKLTEDVTS